MRGLSRELAVLGIMTALLVGGQFALSFVAGVEIVTVLLASFSAVFGVRRGMTVAACFSIVRCFVFGFSGTVIVLYLVYYPLFALAFGLLGRSPRAGLVVFCAAATLITPVFTLIDDVITPLMLGMTGVRWRMYVYYSLPVMAMQTLCACVTTLVGFRPLRRTFRAVRTSAFG